MSLVIYTNGHITMDGQDTGLGVAQGKHGTEVYTREGGGRTYQQHAMPSQRYVLSHAGGNGRNPGLIQFEADLRALLGNA